MNIRHLLITVIFLLAGILAGCGSGTPATGAANVSLTDGPGDDYDHVWITVKAISFHTNPNQVWSSSDASWQTTILPAPVTLDLASLTNGGLDPVFAGMHLPVGSYKQIRLFLAGYGDPLTASAQNVSPTALQYNDQVDYTDANGTVHHVPLEIAYPVQGIQLLGTFNVATGSTLNLAVDFDLEHDLVRFIHGTGANEEYYFTMKPNLRYFDLDQSGAITGYVDPSSLCTTTTGVQSTCAYNMIVKAEILSADQSRHVDTRATTVKSDGSFVLYPLPSGASYDVLIRGHNIDTMLVRGVTAPVGSTPNSGATVLSTSNAPIPLTIDTEYFANFNSTNPLTPSSGYAIFQQTLPGNGEVPYEVRWGNTNPFTGTLAIPMALANGPLQLASYSASNALSFSSVTPEEGGNTDGSYSVVTRGLPIAYYDLSAQVTITTGAYTSVSPLLFTPAMPTLTSGVVAGTVSGTIMETTPGTYDSGYLVISRFANIIDTQNIGAALAATNGGTYGDTLPAGTASYPVPGAYYYGYLWVWNSAHPLFTLKVVPINGMMDLRNTNSVAGMNVTLP